jgi:hypothetical protein
MKIKATHSSPAVGDVTVVSRRYSVAWSRSLTRVRVGLPRCPHRSRKAPAPVHSVTRSRSETGAATVPGLTRPAVNCRRRTHHARGILYFCSSGDCVDNPGVKWPHYVRSRGRGPYSGPLRSSSGHPVYWHEGGGGALPGFRVSFRLRLVGMRGAAAGDHEREPGFHWSWALWLTTVTSPTAGLERAVLIFMAGQRLK